ncbi:hypothetical protein F5144DRAFT_579439 [Chaetomium tenue]|uniref:Uncharacterized protein n=1 Tax=Chaetomium tenue TaxID=1854479 RepID=A0ACB7P5T9_9PEZI|nr:hypothetical protein F5144DRAFT_579439 [Chaetomium globosum]
MLCDQGVTAHAAARRGDSTALSASGYASFGIFEDLPASAPASAAATRSFPATEEPGTSELISESPIRGHIKSTSGGASTWSGLATSSVLSPACPRAPVGGRSEIGAGCRSRGFKVNSGFWGLQPKVSNLWRAVLFWQVPTGRWEVAFLVAARREWLQTRPSGSDAISVEVALGGALDTCVGGVCGRLSCRSPFRRRSSLLGGLLLLHRQLVRIVRSSPSRR